MRQSIIRDEILYIEQVIVISLPLLTWYFTGGFQAEHVNVPGTIGTIILGIILTIWFVITPR